MKIVRFHLPNEGARVGYVVDNEVYDLTPIDPEFFSSVVGILRRAERSRRKVAIIIKEKIDGYNVPVCESSFADYVPTPVTTTIIN